MVVSHLLLLQHHLLLPAGEQPGQELPAESASGTLKACCKHNKDQGVEKNRKQRVSKYLIPPLDQKGNAHGLVCVLGHNASRNYSMKGGKEASTLLGLRAEVLGPQPEPGTIAFLNTHVFNTPKR